MIRLKLILLILLGYLNVFSGDTTHVRVHDKVDMTWYGNYEREGVFPDGSVLYRKVLLNYTMGCASSGCSDWDYTTQIFAMRKTGEIDSTLTLAPSFQVDGNTVDSLFYNVDTTYVYTFSTSTYELEDSSATSPIEIILFEDESDPYLPTDTIEGWPSNFYSYIYDTSGEKIDSTLTEADSLWYTSFTDVYTSYKVTEPIELARVITPYGSGLASNWEREFWFDVTDYITVLKDTLTLRAHYSGWSSGFACTLDFYFIEGTPPRNVIDVKNIYQGNYGYTNEDYFEDSLINNKSLLVDQNTNNAMVRFVPTGHSFDNNQYAAEFYDMEYSLVVNNNVAGRGNIWKDDCGDNSLFPQGGTWLTNRANWCPGDRGYWHDYEVGSFINSGSENVLNIDFASLNWAGHSGTCPVQSNGVCNVQTPVYTIAAQLFTYEDYNHILDAEIVDIIAPTDKYDYSRINPICGRPRIIIKNLGSEVLSSLKITYGGKTAKKSTYLWEGNLAFNEMEEVELPDPGSTAWAEGDSDLIFEVVLSEPNGGQDENTDNDYYFSSYEKTELWPEEILLWYKTNSAGNETSYKIEDYEGNLIFSSEPLAANTTYRDTLNLSPGCYRFSLLDSGCDGLSYFANNDGTGYFRIHKTDGTLGQLSNFNANFGCKEEIWFTVGYTMGKPETISNVLKEAFKVYPNPSFGKFTIDYIAEQKSNCTIYNMLGKELKQFEINAGQGNLEVDINNLSDGIYLLNFKSGSNVYTKILFKE